MWAVPADAAFRHFRLALQATLRVGPLRLSQTQSMSPKPGPAVETRAQLPPAARHRHHRHRLRPFVLLPRCLQMLDGRLVAGRFPPYKQGLPCLVAAGQMAVIVAWASPQMDNAQSNAARGVLAASVRVLAASWLRTPFQGSSFVLCVCVCVRVCVRVSSSSLRVNASCRLEQRYLPKSRALLISHSSFAHTVARETPKKLKRETRLSNLLPLLPPQ